MQDKTIVRISGLSGVVGFAVFLAALPLYFVGMVPGVGLEDPARFSDAVAKTQVFQILRSSIADPLIMICLIVFLAGFRHIVRQKRQDMEWMASLAFGVGLLLVAIELVGDGLQAGAALDTTGRADPSVVRGLMEASFPLYGAIGLIISSLLLASAGTAVLATKALHRWTAWTAFGAAALCLAVAPSILGGTDLTGFYTASGYAPFLGQAALLVWFFAASISMLAKRG
jgi:hypothetical protein